MAEVNTGLFVVGHCLTTTSTFGIIHLQCLQIYFVSWRNTVVLVLHYFWCVGGIALLSDSYSAAAPPPRSPPPPPPPPPLKNPLHCTISLSFPAQLKVQKKVLASSDTI